jgi:hypothetical protein
MLLARIGVAPISYFVVEIIEEEFQLGNLELLNLQRD